MSVVSLATSCALPTFTRLLNQILISDERQWLSWKSSDTPTLAILQIWTASHMYFGVASLCAGMLSSQIGRVLLFASLGLSWAVTQWAPFCLIGFLLHRYQERQSANGVTDGFHRHRTGVVIGLHNAAISAPQMFSAVICSIVFTAAGNGNWGTFLVILSGGCWALVAGFVSLLFMGDLQHI